MLCLLIALLELGLAVMGNTMQGEIIIGLSRFGTQGMKINGRSSQDMDDVIQT